MPRLIVLNGPPGVGKSTIAGRYVDEHVLALDLDLDAIRRRLGGWREDPTRAGLLARELSLVMARAQLAGGYDVVLPQYLGNPTFLSQAESIAAESGATFVEIVLMDDRDTVVRRFAERSATSSDPVHRDAAALVARLGGEELLFTMYDRMILLLNARPGAVVLQCPEGAQDRVYRAVLDAIVAAEEKDAR